MEGLSAGAKSFRVVLFVDVVESVRLMQRDEGSTISRWVEITNVISNDLLPRFAARLERSSGDGLLLTAAKEEDAAALALEIMDVAIKSNRSQPDVDPIQLRIGVDASGIVTGPLDIYGDAINTAARLAGVALPGQIVIADRVRTALPPQFDSRIKDLGDYHLRNRAGTVRAHVLGGGEPRVRLPLLIPDAALRPAIAVVPFAPVPDSDDNRLIGEAFADEIISELSRISLINVISRLSTRRLAGSGQDDTVALARQHLQANYVLSGVCRRRERTAIVDLELSDAKSGLILWSERIEEQIEALFDGSRGPAWSVARPIVRIVTHSELEKSAVNTLPTLENFTLLISGVTMMHHLSTSDFNRAYELLAELANRASRQSTPLAWLAKWHVLRALQGWSDDPQKEAEIALGHTSRALDADQECALAHAIAGFAHTNLQRRFDLGEVCYDRAIEMNPSEPLGWLLKGAMLTFIGQGDKAVASADRALALSPVDPHRYFYHALAAGAHFAAGNDAAALALAESSLNSNRKHHSTYRIKAAAQWRLGNHDGARATVSALLELDPMMTVSAYLATSPAADFPIGREFAHILQQAGVPQ